MDGWIVTFVRDNNRQTHTQARKVNTKERAYRYENELDEVKKEVLEYSRTVSCVCKSCLRPQEGRKEGRNWEGRKE